jgi:hypothetical protein
MFGGPADYIRKDLAGMSVIIRVKRHKGRQELIGLVSDEDAELSEKRWHLLRGYLAMNVPFEIHNPGKPKSRTYLLHRVVMERVLGRPIRRDMVIDHINGNQTDCRRENLREIPHRINMQNRRGVQSNKI